MIRKTVEDSGIEENTVRLKRVCFYRDGLLCGLCVPGGLGPRL